MKPKKRVFCPDCGRPKVLFKTEKEALGFIKWNGDDIDTRGGELRPYFCPGCCGYHISSHGHNSKFDGRVDRMIERYNRDIKASKKLEESLYIKTDNKDIIRNTVNEYADAIDVTKFKSKTECRNFLNVFFKEWDSNNHGMESHIRHEVYKRLKALGVSDEEKTEEEKAKKEMDNEFIQKWREKYLLKKK